MKEKKKILVFGSPEVEEDSLALRVALLLGPEFPEIEFVFIDSTEEIKNFGGKIIAMDAVQGIKKVELIEDLEKVKLPPRITGHDFDAAFNLKLLKKTGQIKEIKIIGIPMDYPEEKAAREAGKKIKAILL
ncbi:MAG: hypothetical protein AB1467_03685 [Candidatus Diapherotrites archaeon]